MRPDLQAKIDRAIKLIKSIKLDEGESVEVAYSGGKDSDVILQLAKESGINYRAIYKNTTIDPGGTIKHAREKGAEVLQPKKNFGEIIQQAGFPNRFKRVCCKMLKEYKVLNKSILGVRRAESTKRAKRYQEPTECRYFGAKTEKNHVVQYYPILDWTDDDIRDFVIDRNIELHPLYYADGGIDVSRRLGCMCCPLKSTRLRVKEFKKYPSMVRFYIRNGQKFLDNHPDSKIQRTYKNVYEWFVRDLFYDKQAEFEMSKQTGLFENTIDYKQFLENYFNIEL